MNHALPKPVPIELLLNRLETGGEKEVSDVFIELLTRFSPLLRHIRFTRGMDVDDYQDFEQDVFLKLFRALPSLRDAKAFPGFFRQIALSVMYDHIRRKKMLTVSLDDLSEDELAHAVDEDIGLPLMCRVLLERLLPHEQQLLQLLIFEGRSSGEVAKTLQLSPGYIRVAKSRVINKLRKLLEMESVYKLKGSDH